MTDSDTIAAISTAPGEGGIGIVRISGKKSAEILGKVFSAPGASGMSGRLGEKDFADRTMYYGHIIDPSSSETIDEVLVVYMKGPRSYTGEDVCEIQCHGGGVPLRHILDVVCGLGAAPAQPGEFTKRAFLNGRIDLVQAGAVIDLIRSKTARGYRAAKEQAEGRLSKQIRAARELLLLTLSEIAVRIDYPEAFENEFGEENEWMKQSDNGGNNGLNGQSGQNDQNGQIDQNGHNDQSGHYVHGREAPEESAGGFFQHGERLNEKALEQAAGLIAAMLEGADAGRLIRDGIRVVIVGKPNAGKSSLFNALAREDAAIVTATPGTTRDSLEIWLDIRGVPVLLTDTAGIRDSSEEIETLGIERAKEQYEKADIAIFLLDGSIPISGEDMRIAELLDPEKKLILAINKTDLKQAFGREEAISILHFVIGDESIISLSLIDDKQCNINGSVYVVEKRLEELVRGNIVSGSSLLVTKARHKVLLESAAAEIEEARAAIADGMAMEFAEVNIRAAWEALGEMIGETAADDVIDRVFEEFCVGK